MNTPVMFSRATDEWRTPRALFEELDAEFGFDLDAAATRSNCWVENYIGPDRQRPDRVDALACEWTWLNGSCRPGVVWLNPPYSRCREFMAKAAKEAANGCTVVCLVPSRTDTRWWHQVVWDAATHAPRPGVEVRFLRGRVRFEGAAHGAPFPSAVVVLRPR